MARTKPTSQGPAHSGPRKLAPGGVPRHQAILDLGKFYSSLALAGDPGEQSEGLVAVSRLEEEAGRLGRAGA